MIEKFDISLFVESKRDPFKIYLSQRKDKG